MRKKIGAITVLLIVLLVLITYNTSRFRNVPVSQEIKQTKLSKKPPDSKKEKSSKKISEKKKVEKQVIVPSSSDGKNVRILIRTSYYKSLYHYHISVKYPSNTIIMIGNTKRRYKKAGKISFTYHKLHLKKKRIEIIPPKGKKLKVLSVKRQGGIISYHGKMRIYKDSNGLLLINVLPMEQYLYGVIPSEMPSGSNMEALKAQAVCARSFTCQQLGTDRYKKYHADLEDNENCQVYNNISETKRGIKAVKETAGIIMKSQGKPVLAFYYATSWGHTASAREAWGKSEEKPYLKAQSLVVEKKKTSGNDDKLQTVIATKKVNYSSEKKFRSFVLKKNLDTYDSKSDWYRWHVTLSGKQLERRMAVLLDLAWQIDPTTIYVQKSNGKYKRTRPSTFGTLRAIRVQRRNKSGLLSSIVVVGSKHTYLVKGQYAIRKVLSPYQATIHKANGKKVTGMTLLPSAAFVIDAAHTSNGLKFVLHGGGFGHGIGMSQTGAENMANRGYSYDEILKVFYKGISFGKCHK